MHNQLKIILPHMLLALAALITYAPDGFAQGRYGTTVNNNCLAFNGTQPFTGDCTLCHAPSPAPKAQRVEPAWTWWQNQLQVPSPLNNFCPQQTNQAPQGTITAPANNATINVGTPVTFSSTGSDPDGNTPLSFAWNFGGGAANSTSQNPSITFNTAGTFTVTLTVTDSLNRADSSPATITIIVKDPNANQAPNGTITSPAANASVQVGESISFAGAGTDPNNNLPLSYLWNFGGAAANSTVQNPTIVFDTAGIFTVTFTVTDSLGLSDPTPATRTITVGTSNAVCTDQDKDLFSPDGGVCGPVDCNDADAAVNPGATEACSDNIDNDCNGKIDGNDAHCKGASCLESLLNQIEITSATWEQDDRKLSVRGYWPTVGATVRLSDAITGAVLGTTRVRSGEDDDEPQASNKYEWRFELERLAVAPCRIQVDIDGRSGTRDVTNAPVNCSSKPPADNRSPVANNDHASTTEKMPVNIAVLANDIDPDKDKLTIVAFTQANNGVVTRNGDILTYTPKSGFRGSDRFTYTISDQRGGTAKATVTVTVKRARSESDR